MSICPRCKKSVFGNCIVKEGEQWHESCLLRTFAIEPLQKRVEELEKGNEELKQKISRLEWRVKEQARAWED